MSARPADDGESGTHMDFFGTGGSDIIVGTDEDDVFDMSQGGHDLVKGRGGDDTFLFGDQFFATDHIYGGEGIDTLVLEGPYQLQTKLHPKTLIGVEVIELVGIHSYALKMSDGNVAAGETLTVIGDGVANGNNISINGRNELDGHFHIIGSVMGDGMIGGAMSDTLDGGKSQDFIRGGGGDDMLIGGEGGDQLTGGAGADRFVYTSIDDSGTFFEDKILDLANNDKIDLSGIDADETVDGDQAFVLVGHFHHQAGQAVLSYDPVWDLTTLSLDVDGDSKADGLITMSGDHTDFTRFVL
jgi:serralysin